MKIKPSFFLLISVVAFASCVNSQNTNGGNSAAQTQTRNVSNFTAVSLEIPAEVTLSQGDFHVEINASPSVLEKIKTEVHGEKLEIKFDNWLHTHVDEPISVQITMPSITALEVNGSGNIFSKSDFSGDHLRLEVNGSGKMSLKNFAVTELKAEINGSGQIVNLSGTASVAKFEINGSGKIDAENFSGKEVDAAVTGSGNMKLSATDLLNADITGSGDIRYKGVPAKKNVDITGSGSVSAL
ncbi:MAG TPA: head GIN domain-containing protein [Chitinophagales bacterium]|nr:head GIN domain-containing protein [Chitinophagales bacterium]